MTCNRPYTFLFPRVSGDCWSLSIWTPVEVLGLGKLELPTSVLLYAFNLAFMRSNWADMNWKLSWYIFLSLANSVASGTWKYIDGVTNCPTPCTLLPFGCFWRASPRMSCDPCDWNVPCSTWLFSSFYKKKYCKSAITSTRHQLN